MPLAAPLIGAGASIVGGAFAGRNQQSGASRPILDPHMQGLQGQVLQTIQSRLRNPAGVPAGYVGQGISAINDAADGAGQATENALTARGLAGSPVAANADLQRTIARTGQIGDFRANVPILARQLQNEDLNLAGNVLNTGRGQSFTSTGTGSPAGGAFNGLAGYLGYLQGSGAFTRPPGVGGPDLGLGVNPILTNTPL